jgi:biopolymer transport protein ExbD
MSRKKNGRGRSEGVQLNLAAMLDMAFQMLMFFILTFSPMPLESQVAMALPAAGPVTQTAPVGPESAVPAAVTDRRESAVTVTVLGSASGGIRDIAVNDTIVPDLDHLGRQMRSVVAKPDRVKTEVILQVDTKLHYQEVMDVLQACNQAAGGNGNGHKITFVELRQK